MMTKQYQIMLSILITTCSLAMADFGIVTNGDFETGDLTGWGGGGAIVSDNGPTLAGSSCAEITDGSNLITSPKFTVIPGEIIKAQWDIKNMSGASGDLWGVFRYYDASNSFLGQKGAKFTADPAGTAWETYTTAEASMPQDAAKADVAFFQAGSYTGAYRIDNVQIDVTAPLSGCTYDFPLYVENGGAEQDTSKWFGWATGSSVIESTEPNKVYCGIKSFQVDTGEYILTAKYPSDPNHVYSIRFNANTTSGSTGELRLFVRMFDELGLLAQTFIPVPLTDGNWSEIGPILIAPTEYYDESLYAVKNMDFWFNTTTGAFDGTAYIDNVRIVDTTSVGNLDGDFNFDSDDLSILASAWLTSNYLGGGLQPDILVDNFEGYANQTELEADWFLSAGWYANTGDGTITLLTDPGQAHTGNNALRFTYDNTGQSGDDAVWTEFRKEFGENLDISLYDEIRIWLNKHPGNSEEQLLYFKFVEDSFAQANLVATYQLEQVDGSSYSPTGWSEWVVNLEDGTFTNGASGPSDLDNVAGMFFGVVGRNSFAGSKGTGTIDFDEITFVDTIPECNPVDLPEDLEGDGDEADCEVNLKDFAIFARYWLNSL